MHLRFMYILTRPNTYQYRAFQNKRHIYHILVGSGCFRTDCHYKTHFSYLFLDLHGFLAVSFCPKKMKDCCNSKDPRAITFRVESVQDFLIKLDIKPLMHLQEISTFSLNNVISRLTKIMNRADKTLIRIFDQETNLY